MADMPVIVINVDYINRLLTLENPAEVAVQLFLSGGWILFVLVALWGIFKAWLEARKDQYLSTRKKVLLAIDIPKDTEQTPKAVESVFAALAGSFSDLDWIERYWEGKQQATYSFELASIGGYIQFYAQTWTKYRDLVEAAIYAQYPDAEIVEVDDYTVNAPKRLPAPGWKMFGSEFKLINKSFYPIRTYPDFEHVLSGELKDPISSLLEGMAKLRPGEQLWLQILVMPRETQKWQAEGERFLKKIIGRKEARPGAGFKSELRELPGSLVDAALMSAQTPRREKPKEEISLSLHLTPGERSAADGVGKKIAKTVFDAKIRYVYLAREEVWAKSRTVSTMKGVFSQFAILNQNAFRQYGKVTTKTDYPWQTRKYWEYLTLFMLRTLITRQNSLLSTFRNRDMYIGAPRSVLNVEELASIFHFPTILVKAPLVKKTLSKRAEPPVQLPVSAVRFGVEQGGFAPRGVSIAPISRRASPPREVAAYSPASVPEATDLPAAAPTGLPGNLPFV